MADESQSSPGGKLKNVLDLEGEHDMDAISAKTGMVTRLKATIEVRNKAIEMQYLYPAGFLGSINFNFTQHRTFSVAKAIESAKYPQQF